jgi:hypothetical protein
MTTGSLKTARRIGFFESYVKRLVARPKGILLQQACFRADIALLALLRLMAVPSLTVVPDVRPLEDVSHQEQASSPAIRSLGQFSKRRLPPSAPSGRTARGGHLGYVWTVIAIH